MNRQNAFLYKSIRKQKCSVTCSVNHKGVINSYSIGKHVCYKTWRPPICKVHIQMTQLPHVPNLKTNTHAHGKWNAFIWCFSNILTTQNALQLHTNIHTLIAG